MARLRDKSKLLQLLAETPVVSFACKKIGLDRTTYYRWYKDDKGFRDTVDPIITIGRMNINDMAEASIIKEINKGNIRACIFWLQYNNPIYRPVRTTYIDPIIHGHDLAPGEICRSCGYREPPIEEYKTNKNSGSKNDETLARELYKRLRSIDTRKKSEGEFRQIIDDFVMDNNLKVQIEYKDFSGNDKKEDDDDETDMD